MPDEPHNHCQPSCCGREERAQAVIRDWEFLFCAYLVYGLARLLWMYLARPESTAFHLGVCCGFLLSGALGFIMRWVFDPRPQRAKRPEQ